MFDSSRIYVVGARLNQEVDAKSVVFGKSPHKTTLERVRPTQGAWLLHGWSPDEELAKERPHRVSRRTQQQDTTLGMALNGAPEWMGARTTEEKQLFVEMPQEAERGEEKYTNFSPSPTLPCSTSTSHWPHPPKVTGQAAWEM